MEIARRAFWVVSCGLVMVGFSATGAAIPTATFERFDSDPRFPVFTGQDRLSKAIIVSHEPDDSGPDALSVGPELLDTTIIANLESEEGKALVADGLRRGDQKLAAAFSSILESYNVSAPKALEVLAAWADSGVDNTYVAAVRNAATSETLRSVLRKYFLTADKDYVRLVANLSDIVGSESRWRSVLAQALTNQIGLTPEVAERKVELAAKSLPDLWSLVELGSRLSKNGSPIGRALVSQTSEPNNLYTKVWESVAAQICKDPRILKDYLEQAPHQATFRRDVDRLLEAASKPFGAEGKAPLGYLTPVVDGLALEALDRTSRSARAVSTLLPVANFSGLYVAGGEIKSSEELVPPLARALDLALHSKGDAWRGWLLWYLTRPAEPTSETLRGSLSAALLNDLELIRQMIGQSPLFTQDLSFDFEVARAGGLRGVEGMPELMRQVAAAEDDPKNIRRYGAAAAAVLGSDDRLWAAAVRGAENYPEGIIAGLTRAAVRSEPRFSLALLWTCTRNDALLGNAFVDWLIASGQVQGRNQARNWLNSLDGQTRGTSNEGNVELARFKEAIIAYSLTPEGWRLIWRRLAIESFAIPGALRGGCSRRSMRVTISSGICRGG